MDTKSLKSVTSSSSKQTYSPEDGNRKKKFFRFKKKRRGTDFQTDETSTSKEKLNGASSVNSLNDDKKAEKQSKAKSKKSKSLTNLSLTGHSWSTTTRQVKAGVNDELERQIMHRCFRDQVTSPVFVIIYIHMR